MAEPSCGATVAISIRCTFCHDGMVAGTAVHCASCLAPHHAECQAQHGRCAAPGCGDRRVLVPDPAGRPERSLAPAARKGAKGEPAPRRLARALGASAAFAALALGLLAAWPVEPAPIAPAPIVAAPSPPPPRPAPPPPQAPPGRLVHEGPATSVALVARDLRLPVVLADGERLVVSTEDRGYTHVVLEPPQGSSRRPETRMVAEPGDPIEVDTGATSLRAGPGEAIVVERGAGSTVRVLVVPVS